MGMVDPYILRMALSVKDSRIGIRLLLYKKTHGFSMKNSFVTLIGQWEKSWGLEKESPPLSANGVKGFRSRCKTGNE